MRSKSAWFFIFNESCKLSTWYELHTRASCGKKRLTIKDDLFSEAFKSINSTFKIFSHIKKFSLNPTQIAPYQFSDMCISYAYFMGENLSTRKNNCHYSVSMADAHAYLSLLCVLIFNAIIILGIFIEFKWKEIEKHSCFQLVQSAIVDTYMYLIPLL